ncbi:8021_t:CDS:2, partial [Funneliformis mosseae]
DIEIDNFQNDNQNDNAIKWIKDALDNEKVKFIPFDQLEKPKPLNTGGFGCILKANWIKTGNCIVYKKLTNIASIKGSILDDFIHELKINLQVDYCDRIVRCLGISQVDISDADKISEQTALSLAIVQGTREVTIDNTPKDYEELYQHCWDSEPEKRPTIKIILEKIKKNEY